MLVKERDNLDKQKPYGKLKKNELQNEIFKMVNLKKLLI
jgi:hypothetical protein